VEEKEVSHPKLYYKEELSKRENQNYYINIQKKQSKFRVKSVYILRETEEHEF